MIGHARQGCYLTGMPFLWNHIFCCCCCQSHCLKCKRNLAAVNIVITLNRIAQGQCNLSYNTACIFWKNHLIGSLIIPRLHSPLSLRWGEDELPVQTLCRYGYHLPDGSTTGLQQQRDRELQRAAGEHTDEREGAAENHQVPAGCQDDQPWLTESKTAGRLLKLPIQMRHKHSSSLLHSGDGVNETLGKYFSR